MFHLRSLELLHWDYCQRLNLPLDGSIITVAGPNGSGKTTLLDAMRTLLGLDCSGGRSYKTYARHANADSAWLRATVDNRPTSRQSSSRPFARCLLFADTVTLVCRIERNGGDWQRRSIGPADWKWLSQQFDLERLRITGFAPMLWLAGRVALSWNDAVVDTSGLHCAGIALDDVPRAASLRARSTAGLQRYWLIENRTSFERQARQCPDGTALIWMPGRPSRLWLDAVGHLLRLAPAPVWISADADPSGVDIALSVGALWQEKGLMWSPHRMGVEELAQSDQLWLLNEHDRALLSRLLERPDMPTDLRSLCEVMLQSGRKAEQEAWL